MGGHENIDFTSKDPYNNVDAMGRFKIKDTDVEGVLAYLCKKAKNCLSFYYKFNVDDKGQTIKLVLGKFYPSVGLWMFWWCPGIWYNIMNQCL